MRKGAIVQKPFWVITNIKRNSIWKGPFVSKDEAESELKLQTSLLHTNMTAKNWIIEERSFWGEEDGLEDF